MSMSCVDLTSEADEGADNDIDHVQAAGCSTKFSQDEKKAPGLEEEVERVATRLQQIANEINALKEERLELLQYKTIIDGERNMHVANVKEKTEKQTIDSWNEAASAKRNRNHPVPISQGWEGSNQTFPWTKKLHEALKSVFKINGPLRSMQRAAINATLSNEDVFLIMPTGAGKSLCYQLPAALDGISGAGLTLIVSPLLSLIEDQVYQLKLLNISVHELSSNSSKAEVARVYADMDALCDTSKGKRAADTSKSAAFATKLCMLYVTPERIAKSKRLLNKLEKLYASRKLRRIVIDETHCCSQWGNDFRPDYKQLGVLRVQFPDVPILAVTATATQPVWKDVVLILRIPKCITFRAPIERPNLRYAVKWKAGVGNDSYQQVLDFIKEKHMDGCGIIYCISQKETESMADFLRINGIKAAYYHANMTPEYRKAVHQNWLVDRVHVLACTVAFGMGINKKDVRFVLHHSLSKSIENYYQESGRAGRDGRPSDCVLFYRGADLIKQSTMVFAEYTGLSKLYSLVEYCTDTSVCRHVLFKEYFGQELEGDGALGGNRDAQHCHSNAMCDTCAAGKNIAITEDVTRDAIVICTLLKAVLKNRERVTMAKLIDVWKGLARKKTIGIEKVEVAPKNYTRPHCERIITRLLIDNVIKEEFAHTPYSTNSYFVLGVKAQLVERGLLKIVLRTRDVVPEITTTKRLSHEVDPRGKSKRSR
eukprot:CFRG0323T1